jgi:hypothetical protein
MRRHVERRDPRFGEDGAVRLVAISAHGSGQDLGSACWGGYGVESCAQWLSDGGERFEKKNHAAM